jgi:hypothetical protein
MILKLGTSQNSFRLIPNISSFEYTNKIIPNWNDISETFEEYLRRIDIPGSNFCMRKTHGFDDVFDGNPIFPDFDPDHDKNIIEYHKYHGDDYKVRCLSFIVNNIHMSIYTPFVCYVCNDDGKTFETLR